MAHVPESVTTYVCESCQVTHAGTPVHLDTGDHRFDEPESCGACGEETLIEATDWVHHHD